MLSSFPWREGLVYLDDENVHVPSGHFATHSCRDSSIVKRPWEIVLVAESNITMSKVWGSWQTVRLGAQRNWSSTYFLGAYTWHNRQSYNES